MGSPAKLERQLNLMATLLETRRPLTRRELQQKLAGYPDDDNAWRRAFERDKDELRQMGIPIALEPVGDTYPPEEGYRIRRDQYYLRDPGLTSDELAALQFAASVVRLEGVESVSGLYKLGGRATPGGADDTGPEVEALPTAPHVVPLFQAVAERRPATFEYNGEKRTVDSYRLDFLRGHWYLSGYDHLRGEERNFRVDRIDSEVSLGDANAFEHPATTVPGARLQPWQIGEGEPISAVVRVDADQAPIAPPYLGDDAVTTVEPDGSLLVELSVTNVAGFRSFVLGFLDHAEVLGPKELHDDMVAWLEALSAAPASRARR